MGTIGIKVVHFCKSRVHGRCGSLVVTF